MVCTIAGFPTSLSNRAVEDIWNLKTWVLGIAVDVCVVRNVSEGPNIHKCSIYIKDAPYFLKNLWYTRFCSIASVGKTRRSKCKNWPEMDKSRNWCRMLEAELDKYAVGNEISFDKLHFSSFIVVQRRINSAWRQPWRYCLIYWCQTEITSQRVIFLTHYWFDLGRNRSP